MDDQYFLYIDMFILDCDTNRISDSPLFTLAYRTLESCTYLHVYDNTDFSIYHTIRDCLRHVQNDTEYKLNYFSKCNNRLNDCMICRIFKRVIENEVSKRVSAEVYPNENHSILYRIMRKSYQN